MAIKTFVDGGINWNWYLQGDFREDQTVEVYFYDRWHKYENRGSNHPKSDRGHMWMKESEGRILTEITVDGVKYKVTNPAQIFSYRDFTHLVTEP